MSYASHIIVGLCLLGVVGFTAFTTRPAKADSKRQAISADMVPNSTLPPCPDLHPTVAFDVHNESGDLFPAVTPPPPRAAGTAPAVLNPIPAARIPSPPPATVPSQAPPAVQSSLPADPPSSPPADTNPQVHTALTAYASAEQAACANEKASVLAALHDLLKDVVKANTTQLQVGNPGESTKVAGLQERLCDLISRTQAADGSAAPLPGPADIGTPDELPRMATLREALGRCTLALQRAATQRAQGSALAAAKARTGLQAAVQAALQRGDMPEVKRITGIEKDLGKSGSTSATADLPATAAAGTKTSTGTPAGAGRKIDLLKLVDVQKDGVAGTWACKNGSLQSDDTKYARLAFAYEPPEEYDYHVSFSREVGKDCIGLELVVGGHRTCWVMGAEKDTLCRFDTMNPTPCIGPAVRGKPCLVQHGRYDCVIQVRRGTLTVVVNGKLIGVDKAEGASAQKVWANYTARSGWTLPDEKALGVGSYASGFKIYAADVQEISGPGKVLR